MPDAKSTLSIVLTEPIVFLRSSDPSGRLQTEPNAAPTLVRGVLTLNVIKPIEVTRIEVELVGLSTITLPIEGVGSYRADAPETRKLYSSSVTIFRAGQVPRRSRPSSVGPGSSTSNFDDVHEHAGIAFSRPPSSRRHSGRSSSHGTYFSPSPSIVPSIDRRIHYMPHDNSITDASIVIETAGVPLDFGPTPPYTPAAQSQTMIESRFGIPEEHPNSTLGGLPRQALYNSMHVDGPVPVSSRSNSVAASPAHHAAQSSASSNTHTSLDLEDDNHSNEMPHTSPPHHESDVSSHSTAEDLSRVLHHRAPPSRHSSIHSPESIHSTRLRARDRDRGRDDSNASPSNSRLRLSLSSVLGAVAEMTARSPSRSRSIAEEMERGRSRDRMSREHQIRDHPVQTDEGVAGTSSNDNLWGTNKSHPPIHTEHREHHFLGLGRFFGFDHDHEKVMNGAHPPKDHEDGGMEFKPGTYSYPISFLIQPDLPPTFSVPHGSMDYHIKGVAHRPGTFTSKLSCKVPLLVVAIGDGEDAGTGDLGPISLERQWQGRLAYSFDLSSRLFLLGSQRHPEVAAASIHSDTRSLADSEAEMRTELTYGTAALNLTLLPTEKIKIWKLSAFVEQRISYLGEGGQPLRADDRRLVKVFQVKDECPAEEMDSVNDGESQAHKNKQEPIQIPLLPSPLSPHRSPLLQHVPPSSDPSVLIGPGPYELSFVLGLPGCNGPSSSDNGLHFTMKQKNWGVRVQHTLKFIIRLERPGDLDDTHDHEEKAKSRYFDLSLQAPITILSCRCDPKFQTLPSYSQTMEDNWLEHTACPCQPSTASSTGGPGHLGEREHDEIESPPLQGQEHGHEHVASTWTTPTSASSSSSFNAGSDGGVVGHPHHHRSPPDEHHWSGQPNPLTLAMAPGPPSPSTSWAHESGLSASASPGPSIPGVHDDWHAQPKPHLHGHLRSPSSQSQSQSHAHAWVHVHTHSLNHPHTPPVLTPHSSRPPSPLARYERLVSGLESEAGEAPPSYDSIAASGSDLGTLAE